MGSKKQRILIYRLGSLGDTIVSLPALRVVARAFPDAHRRMITNLPINTKAPSAATVLENTGLVHSYIRYPAGTRDALALVKLAWRILRWRPHALVYLSARRGVPAAFRDVRFFRLCGVKRFYGVPDTEESQQVVWLPQRGIFEPEAERLCRQIAELGVGHPEDSTNWSMALSPQEHASTHAAVSEALGEPFGTRATIAISLGTKLQANDWGKENWRGLLERIAAYYPGYTLLVTGVSDEREASEFALAGWRSQPGAGPALNLCGRLSLRQTGCAFAMADLFIGHDSGPIHLASTVAVPSVGIFAARNLPGVWFPHGARNKIIYHRVECCGCRLETCIVEKKRCITSITHEEVMAAVISVLDPIVTQRTGPSTAPPGDS